MSKPLILVVDDEDLNRIFLERILSRRYEVTSAVDGKEALEMFCDAVNPFDIVITDRDMPNMNGVELCRRLKGIRTVPVVLCSARVSKTASQASNEDLSIFDALVGKPFKFEELYEAIEGCCPCA